MVCYIVRLGLPHRDILCYFSEPPSPLLDKYFLNGPLQNGKLIFFLRAAVTDDLISPKYDDDICNDESTDDGDDEDEESDDTVYECPGKMVEFKFSFFQPLMRSPL